MRLDRPWSLVAGGWPHDAEAVGPAAAVARPRAAPAGQVAQQRAASGSFPHAPGAGPRRAAFRKCHGGDQRLLSRPARRGSRLEPVAPLMAQAPDAGALSTRGRTPAIDVDGRRGIGRGTRCRSRPPVPAGLRATLAEWEGATPMYRKARAPSAPATIRPRPSGSRVRPHSPAPNSCSTRFPGAVGLRAISRSRAIAASLLGRARNRRRFLEGSE